jgi:hypothetical protein
VCDKGSAATARDLTADTACSSRGRLLGLGAVDEVELYRALDWLGARLQSRETRLFQMTQRVPGLIWSLLIILASGLIGFAAEGPISKAVLIGVFTSSLTLALLTVRVLDFPFESALQLSSRDFNETLEKVDHLIAAAQPRVEIGPASDADRAEAFAKSIRGHLEYSGRF